MVITNKRNLGNVGRKSEAPSGNTPIKMPRKTRCIFIGGTQLGLDYRGGYLHGDWWKAPLAFPPYFNTYQCRLAGCLRVQAAQGDLH